MIGVTFTPTHLFSAFRAFRRHSERLLSAIVGTVCSGGVCRRGDSIRFPDQPRRCCTVIPLPNRHAGVVLAFRRLFGTWVVLLDYSCARQCWAVFFCVDSPDYGHWRILLRQEALSAARRPGRCLCRAVRQLPVWVVDSTLQTGARATNLPNSGDGAAFAACRRCTDALTT